MKTKIISTTLFFIIFTINAIELKYKFTKEQILYIETNSIINQFVNGEHTGNTKLKEISYITTKDFIDNQAVLNSKIYTLVEENIINRKIYKINKEHNYKYKKNLYGKTSNLNFLEGYHDFPQFEKRDVKIGDSWILPSFYNVRMFGKNTPILKIDFNIVYRLIDIKEIEGKSIALISAKAIFTYEKNKEIFKIFNIIKFIGFNDFLIEFDITNGRVKRIEEIFDYTYILKDNTLIESSGRSVSEYEVPPPIKESEVDKMREKIEKDKNIDIHIKMKEDKSLSISLENIQFRPDSAILTDEEKNRLDKIAIMLENYKSNHILIIGHTADIGKPKEQQFLSEERAKSVLNYLVEKHNFNPDLLSYQGKGGTEPIGDNSTEEGRKKNRRVEIIVLPK